MCEHLSIYLTVDTCLGLALAALIVSISAIAVFQFLQEYCLTVHLISHGVHILFPHWMVRTVNSCQGQDEHTQLFCNLYW
jgi:Na+-transporting NADH:ubiquinone oxidoreductase subunit NqrE